VEYSVRLKSIVVANNMATPRLYFLYPSFFRSAGAVELGPIRTSVRQRPARATFTTSPRCSAEPRPQRYGTAKEPPPHLLGEARAGRASTTDTPAREQEIKDAAEKAKSTLASTPAKEEPAPPGEPEVAANPEPTSQGQDTTPTSTPPIEAPPAELKSSSANPLETVLSMPSPAEESEEDKPPHLQTPRYVHHFDTYGLVQGLGSGGFTPDQSTTIMKAVRTLLTENMDLARRSLVSKSNVENETYLFKAACSELKTEVQNNRKVEAEKQRTQRAHLQHEVDILNQRVGQDAITLKDELKGMFDDRKMAVRMEQRSMESKVCDALSKTRLNPPLIMYPRYKNSTTKSPSL
jgi:hypothetical protein